VDAAKVVEGERSDIARAAVRARWLKAGKLKEIEANAASDAEIGPTQEAEP